MRRAVRGNITTVGSNSMDDGASPADCTAATGGPELIYAAANRAYAAGDLARAEGLYRRVVLLQAGHIAARNNLAALLLDESRKVTQ